MPCVIVRYRGPIVPLGATTVLTTDARPSSTLLSASGTIEQRIHEVLEQKRELFNQLFAEAGTPRTVGLTQKEIFDLFELRLPTPAKKAA